MANYRARVPKLNDEHVILLNPISDLKDKTSNFSGYESEEDDDWEIPEFYSFNGLFLFLIVLIMAFSRTFRCSEVYSEYDSPYIRNA